MLHAVILAGGGGTRLWPLSRTQFPKQFLSLLGDQTLLQQTVSRLETMVTPQCVWIVTGKDYQFLVQSQLAALPRMSTAAAQVLTEPLARNTAAAIGLAAMHIQRRDPEAVMIVLPADHWIERRDAFVALLQEAATLAKRDFLVTLGIVPNRPETGYGYIKRGSLLAQPPGQTPPYQVERFVEKPSLPVAQEYVSSGLYYWNAGIFLWRAATILQEIATHMPALHAGLMEIARSLDKKNAADALATIYQRLESVSIDYGVLEKASRLVVVPADIGWSDLGEWTTIHRLSPHDARGNTLTGNVVNLENDNSFIYSSRRPVAAIGLKNVVVVDTDDALLVCAQDRVQEVKTVVQHLQTQGAEVATTAFSALRRNPSSGIQLRIRSIHPGIVRSTTIPQSPAAATEAKRIAENRNVPALPGTARVAATAINAATQTTSRKRSTATTAATSPSRSAAPAASTARSTSPRRSPRDFAIMRKCSCAIAS